MMIEKNVNSEKSGFPFVKLKAILYIGISMFLMVSAWPNALIGIISSIFAIATLEGAQILIGRAKDKITRLFGFFKILNPFNLSNFDEELTRVKQDIQGANHEAAKINNEAVQVSSDAALTKKQADITEKKLQKISEEQTKVKDGFISVEKEQSNVNQLIKSNESIMSSTREAGIQRQCFSQQNRDIMDSVKVRLDSAEKLFSDISVSNKLMKNELDSAIKKYSKFMLGSNFGGSLGEGGNQVFINRILSSVFGKSGRAG